QKTNRRRHCGIVLWWLCFESARKVMMEFLCSCDGSDGGLVWWWFWMSFYILVCVLFLGVCLWSTSTSSVLPIFHGSCYVSLVFGYGCFVTTALAVVPLSSSGV
ncbi:hypothetical protein A2U01_0017464, partial [Trifolium medium]|nr:hypothetical protein [Trifolium medium]